MLFENTDVITQSIDQIVSLILIFNDFKGNVFIMTVQKKNCVTYMLQY
jgi:hypothetical protein